MPFPMTKLIATTFATLLLTPACSLLGTSPAQSPDAAGSAETSKARSKAKAKKTKAAAASHAKPAPAEKKPTVGDFFVHRFTGSYRETPLLLTEEVVAIEAGIEVVDYTLVDGDQSYTLRVRRHLENGLLAQVSELNGDSESPAPMSAYEALLAKTVFAPDINVAALDEAKETCLIGPEELDCQVNKYRVFVGDTEATLSVTRSDDLPGRDIAGEILAVNGDLIYRAELIESGRGEEMLEAEVASAK
jgi:hypothetical protein